MNRKITEEKRSDTNFATRTVSKIWQEIPAPDNPYLASTCSCHGYDILELARSGSFAFSDVVYLLFKGELPDRGQSSLLNALFIAFINPGPRHPATRAAMNAGVGKTDPAHILPIGLTVLGGKQGGGKEVEEAMRFFRKNGKILPEEMLTSLAGKEPDPVNGNRHFAPGFGSRFGGVDPQPLAVAGILEGLEGSSRHLCWGNRVAALLEPLGVGWLTAGVVAATLCDLGFHPRTGPGIYQLLAAPGILAHGLELANKPITAMPFIDERNYIIAEEARARKR